MTENKEEHNLCLVVALGVFRGQLEGIKEVQKIEFSDITPQWSETGDPYVLTIPLTTKNTFIALYRLVAGKYKLDTATTCKVNEVSVTITAPTKFTGYILVTGLGSLWQPRRTPRHHPQRRSRPYLYPRRNPRCPLQRTCIALYSIMLNQYILP